MSTVCRRCVQFWRQCVQFPGRCVHFPPRCVQSGLTTRSLWRAPARRFRGGFWRGDQAGGSVRRRSKFGLDGRLDAMASLEGHRSGWAVVEQPIELQEVAAQQHRSPDSVNHGLHGGDRHLKGRVQLRESEMRDVAACDEVAFDATEVGLASVLETQGLHDAAVNTTVAGAGVNQTKKRQDLGIRIMDASRMPDLDKQCRTFMPRTVRFVGRATVNDLHEAVRMSGRMATARASCGLREPGTARRRTFERPPRWPRHSCRMSRLAACPQTRPTCANAWPRSGPACSRRSPSSPGLPAGLSPYSVRVVARPTTLTQVKCQWSYGEAQPARTDQSRGRSTSSQNEPKSPACLSGRSGQARNLRGRAACWPRRHNGIALPKRVPISGSRLPKFRIGHESRAARESQGGLYQERPINSPDRHVIALLPNSHELIIAVPKRPDLGVRHRDALSTGSSSPSRPPHRGLSTQVGCRTTWPVADRATAGSDS